MNVAIVFLVLVALHTTCAYILSNNKSLDDIWIEFKKVHNKCYESKDLEITRRFIWERNLQRINEHNHLTAVGQHSYWLGINEYSDMLDDEFRAFMNGLRPQKRNSTLLFSGTNVNDLPKEIDWRKKGYVTEVKNQKKCGSCWAFAATGALEGQYFKKTGKLVSLSEQNLIDCTDACGNNGCEGGLVERAYQCIQKEGGIDSEANYPYEAKDDKCRYNRKAAITSLSNYVDITHFDEDALQKAVATVGPISVAIDAHDFTFAQYKSGIYESTECNDITLDHGVLVVGYGTENGKDYWLVKNSWGPSWGMNGYIKMARNAGNMCGIATLASYPIL